MEQRQNDTRSHYAKVIERSKEKMQAEFEHENIPASVLDQICAAWMEHIERQKVMDPASKDPFRHMGGLPAPMPKYREEYFSRETNLTLKVDSKQAAAETAQPEPPKVPVKAKLSPEAAEPEEADPYAALFNSMKAQSEEQKAPPPQKEPSEDELAHVSDEETSIVAPMATDSMVALYQKISRSKTKWKCTLSHCVLNLSGKDVLFKQINGTMEFQ